MNPSLRLVACGVGLAWMLAGCSADPAQSPSDRPREPRAEAARIPAAQEPAPAKAQAELRLSPASVVLGVWDPGVQVRVERVRGDEVRDVTSEAEWAGGDKRVVRLEPGGYLQPAGAGHTNLLIRADGLEAGLAVEVGEAASLVSFAQDVLPLLTRAGCNTGACHARKGGQGGFHLSLYGFDARADFEAVAREAGGRRLNVLEPAASLVLQKATGRSAHGGGRRVEPGSRECQTIAAWIEQGARPDTDEATALVRSIRVEPASIRLAQPGSGQLRVLAELADGRMRDITRLASFHARDSGRLRITENGRFTLTEPGQADVLVRYRSRVANARVTAPHNQGHAYTYPDVDPTHPIDAPLLARLKALNVPASELSSDASFLRRVSLDLTGQLPTPDEIREFLADTGADRRASKVESLLKRQDFLDFWTLKLGDLLQVSQARLGPGAGLYQNWLRSQLAANRPWNELVRELLTSTGDPLDPVSGGPVNYALEGPDALVQAEQTARRFLGIRMRCAQCHDHPFDVWTQDDYYHLAAFFAKVSPGPASADVMMPSRRFVRVNPDARINHPRTGAPVEPRQLDGCPVELGPSDDPREAFAEWVTRPDNPLLARSYVNWVWAQFFGRGLVDPADDMSVANPAVHPEVLDSLAAAFVRSGYDTRWLLTTLCTSRTYGLASLPVDGNAFDHLYFSHQEPRPLSAHQMADALAQATQVPNVFANRSARSHTRAIQVFDPGSPSSLLDAFGRCRRDVSCSPVSAPRRTLAQALLLIGGDTIDGRVSNVRGYLTHLLELEPSARDVVGHLYFRTLCRKPTSDELDFWTIELERASSLSEASADLFWALLNSREFAFNH